jgi:hypothetical protein
LAERRPQIVAFYNEQYFMPGNITLAIWYLARPEPLLVQGEGRAPDRHRGPGHRKAGKAGGIARPGCGCRAAAEKAEGPALIVDACRSRRDTPSIGRTSRFDRGRGNGCYPALPRRSPALQRRTAIPPRADVHSGSNESPVWGMSPSSRLPSRVAAICSVRRPSARGRASSETRRFRTLAEVGCC